MPASINKILALPVNKGYSSWGADMGRRNWVEGDPEKLHLQKVQFQDACYDAGGAYWVAPRICIVLFHRTIPPMKTKYVFLLGLVVEPKQKNAC
jgi:hypothetical protein